MIDKPTPTPLPPGSPFFQIPSGVSLWGSTDYAIQSWNLLGNGRFVIQAIFLVAMVIIGAFVFGRFLDALTRRDSQS